MKNKISFFAALSLILFSAGARAAAPLLEIETFSFGKPYSSLSVNTQGEVKMVTQGKEVVLLTLAQARVAQLESQLDALTDFALVDQDPKKIPCPSHFATHYNGFNSAGKKRTFFQLTPACHRMEVPYPAGGQPGPATDLYQNVHRLMRTLDLTGSLYYNLVEAQ